MICTLTALNPAVDRKPMRTAWTLSGLAPAPNATAAGQSLLIGDAEVGRHLDLWCQRITPLRHQDEGCHFEMLLRRCAAAKLGRAAGEAVAGAPTALIAAAEARGMGARLDRWVVERSLGWLETHPQEADTVHSCSVNLAAGSLADRDFGRYLRQRVERSSVAPASLCFEITETGPVGNIKRAAELVRSLRALGCRFALDDFGSGYCSFSYLTDLDLDWVKIDGRLVRDALHSPVALAIVLSIVQIARVADLLCVAEWVDSPQLLQRMQEIGIDFAQGYQIGRPMPLEEFFAGPTGA